jgi:protein-disulfide isomerase
MNTQNIQNYLIPIAIVVAGGLVAAGIFFSGTDFGKNTDTKALGTDQQAEKQIEVAPITSDDHILGNPNADIIMVEYSDTECPYCKNFHSTLHQAINDYGKDGKVAWVYRHFPIDQLHPKARKEAEATECAAEQGGNDAFWKYTNEVYARTPSNNKLDAAELPKIASEIGLDVDAFNTCLASGRMASKVEADYQDAVKAGGQGTPYLVFLRGKDVIPMDQGAVPYATLKGMIDSLLK